MLSLSEKFPQYFPVRANILDCVKHNLISLDAVRTSVSLLNVLDKIINQCVAKVRLSIWMSS